MKKLMTILIIMVIAFTALGVDYTPAYAQAYGSDFVSMIHYQNVGSSDATITLTLIDASGVGTDYTLTTLAPNGATSIYAGTLTGTTGFKGSATLSSDQPLATTVAQIGSGDVKNQPLSNGFSTGSSSVLIPTVLKNKYFFNSVFSVQNVDDGPADLTMTFVNVFGGTQTVNVDALPSGAAHYVDMGVYPAITSSSFNGSVVIDAVEAGTSTPGSIVATSMELEIAGNNAYAFNGAAETASKIYMPTAVCNYGPNNENISAYAVQNTTPGAINVTVTYSNGNVDGPYRLEGFSKRSFLGCEAGNPTGFLGSAVVEATGNIHAVGKVFGGGLYPAHLAFIDGDDKVALPFVRWTESHWEDGMRQRTYIAVQNIGDTFIPAGSVKAHYYDKDGNLVGTHELGSIGVGKKANTWASFIGAAGNEFGYYSDGSTGGGAIIEGPAGSELAVVVRVQTYIGNGNSVGEDYEGIPIE